ncbi:helix-turn-helix transcriptional regulator [Lysinibacillus sp. 1 U-2021]|uniref:helix-turn-helix domain-containing protein n=1 Tax=Lysinibacillus sp. 1 U-2021 TaxID=3039426 RepID=UPI002480BD3D|nr:helix-turn-helix transcriptional regulator [Lysinibacillus sp. 1 U-2021]WGT38534.1 helix-turn-helix transcriptional regulator [Lysinibacillus sp. 1 U-2021]
MLTVEEIRQKRKSRGLSITQLSNLSGVSQPYISQIESGERVATAKTLNKLLEALGVSKLYSLRAQGYLDETDILALLDENKRFREALEFYANDELYPDEDLGVIARKALAGESDVQRKQNHHT